MADSPTNFEKVREFHTTFGHHANERPGTLPVDVQRLRIKLIDEEFGTEYIGAAHEGDVVELADALADILYVTYGAMIAHGFPADELFAEVHRSNMSKLGEDGKPITNEYGKSMKGPNYSPPNIARVLREHGWTG